jgi:hypothetical protein
MFSREREPRVRVHESAPGFARASILFDGVGYWDGTRVFSRPLFDLAEQLADAAIRATVAGGEDYLLSNFAFGTAQDLAVPDGRITGECALTAEEAAGRRRISGDIVLRDERDRVVATGRCEWRVGAGVRADAWSASWIQR